MNRKLYLALFLTILSTSLGASLVVPLLPVYVSEMGATGLEVGLIFSAFSLCRSLVLPLVGSLADRWGGRSFVLTGLALFTLVSLAYTLAHSVFQIILCRVLQGAAAAMVFPVVRSVVGQMTPVGHEGRVMGHFNAAFFGGLAAGPFLGGYVKDFWGIEASFQGMGLLSLASLILCWLSLPPLSGPPRPDGPRQSAYSGLLRDPTLLAVTLFRFGSIICSGVNWSFLPLYGHSTLGLSSGQVGILISVTLVLPTVLQPFFGRLADRLDRAALTTVGGILAALCLMAVPWCPDYPSLLGLNLVMGVAFGLYAPPLMALAVEAGRRTQRMTPVMSLLEIAFSLGMVVGPLLAGLVKEYWGLTQVFTVGGVAGLLTVAVFEVLLRLRPAKIDI